MFRFPPHYHHPPGCPPSGPSMVTGFVCFVDDPYTTPYSFLFSFVSCVFVLRLLVLFITGLSFGGFVCFQGAGKSLCLVSQIFVDLCGLGSRGGSGGISLKYCICLFHSVTELYKRNGHLQIVGHFPLVVSDSYYTDFLKGRREADQKSSKEGALPLSCADEYREIQQEADSSLF